MLELMSDPLSGFDPDLRAKARAFAQNHIAPDAENWEARHVYPRNVVGLASKGFNGFLVPRAFGGIRGSPTDFSDDR